MTYSSLSIRRYSENASDADIATYSTESDRVIDLSLFSDRLFPHRVVAWAEERGMSVHFVDNEWVRVVINDVSDLVDLAQWIEAGEEVGRLIADVDLSLGRLVVESEAF